MGLLTLIQIPYHHLLANKIALNLKYHLKQFFNINLGIGIIKKSTFFVRIFDISPSAFTQILRSGKLPGCEIKFRIQRVPTRHTFLLTLLSQNKKYLKKVCRVGTRWMRNLISHPTSSPDRNLSKITWRYVKNMNKKVVFFFSFLPPKLINIILLFF